MNQNDQNTPGVRPMRRIMIAVDDSNASRQALRFAARIASPQAEVRIVCVADQPGAWIAGGAFTAGDAWITDTIATARKSLHAEAELTLEQALAAFKGRCAAVEGLVVGQGGESGAVVQALVAAARDWRADLLVVGARHRGRVKRWVDGSVSGALAVAAPCPLLVVPDEYATHESRAELGLARVVLATDGSEPSVHAIGAAMRLLSPPTILRAVYVVDRSGVAADPVPGSALQEAMSAQGRKALAAAVGQLAPSGCTTETQLVATALIRDDVAHAVLRDAQAWDADLVVLGTHGRRGVARWLLGSVAQRAVEVTHLPLLLVGPAQA
ncbi:nucleotide-binding universal stress UspA family protein [Paraburkholderia bannensis]|uniref:Nucleotide-binding universal stress UspA family protein n=1 Tax=Paraburkholderia bannensis TaxID=765414 RepID=A0A7W9TVL4_9BURK|nr:MULTISPECIES: universal stress protein [Paraburkholderia]MBB3256965.1 nucleotide-binding universal stress UspA family protein [Paraburkholderia sp. WP4_3_2]MBB6101919.1 nucleotide-binding universal stress UspA family protein [Paraburkholderia bannensis]